jgi:predicted RNase H-like nuclease (RuvC/YqgF family)
MAFNVTRPIPVNKKLKELNEPTITNYVERLERTINEMQNIDRIAQRENLLHESKRYNEELELNSRLTDQVLNLESEIEELKRRLNATHKPASEL